MPCDSWRWFKMLFSPLLEVSYSDSSLSQSSGPNIVSLMFLCVCLYVANKLENDKIFLHGFFAEKLRI